MVLRHALSVTGSVTSFSLDSRRVGFFAIFLAGGMTSGLLRKQHATASGGATHENQRIFPSTAIDLTGIAVGDAGGKSIR
jgi:hypothetical protein